MTSNLNIYQIICILAVVINGFEFISSAPTCPEKRLVCHVSTENLFYFTPLEEEITAITEEVAQNCTHFVHDFVGLSFDGKINAYNLDKDDVTSAFKFLRTLREKNPCAKLMVSIGDPKDGLQNYLYIVETAERREAFAESVMRFLIFHEFDGMNLNWYYSNDDKQKLVELLKALKTKLSAHNKILSISLPTSKDLIAKGCDIEKICKTVDFITLKPYTSPKNVATIISPLKNEPGEHLETIEDAALYLTKNGCSSNQIVLSFSKYYEDFTLKDSHQTDVGAPTTRPSTWIRNMESLRRLGLNSMCSKGNQSEWTHKFRPNNAVKISHKERSWVVYDDEETVQLRAKYVLDNDLGGLVYSSIDSDSSLMDCYKVGNPLLIAASNALYKPNNVK